MGKALNDQYREDKIKELVNSLQPKRDAASKKVLETYCNFFIDRAARLWGCEELGGKSAHEIVAYMQRAATWRRVTFAEGQQFANAGDLVVMGCLREPGGQHGHVALVVPGDMEESGKFGCRVPQLANVGARNFYNEKASMAFQRDQEPELFVWRELHHDVKGV